MKKCFRCGFETLENANFCSNCGVALKDPMPEIVYLTDEKKQKNEIVAEENLETEISEIPEQLPNDEIIGENGLTQDGASTDEIISTESFDDAKVDDNLIDGKSIDVENHEEKKRKILWIPEWAFYTTLLILGVLAIVTYKFINDPEWNKLVPDMSCLFAATNEVVQKEDEKDNLSATDTIEVSQIDTSIKVDNNVAQQLLTKGDSTYHVVVMTLKSIESAEKIIASGKYNNAYIISDSTLHRIAVYNNVDKAKAKHYLDSIANQDAPGAWIFHGTVK